MVSSRGSVAPKVSVQLWLPMCYSGSHALEDDTLFLKFKMGKLSKQLSFVYQVLYLSGYLVHVGFA
jgi:hypothetical protein